MTRNAWFLLAYAALLLPLTLLEHQHHIRVMREFASPTSVHVSYSGSYDTSICPWRERTQGCLIRT